MTQDRPLNDWRIILPNRRACRHLRDAFLRLNDGSPLLLPAMHPLGEDSDNLTPLSAQIPPSVSEMERLLVLTRAILIHRDDWTIDRALALAGDLAQLIDRSHREEVDMVQLSRLVPDDYAQHWQITLSFLTNMLGSIWPNYLQERELIDPAHQRRLMIESLNTALQDSTAPIILAGTQAPTPHIAQLAKTITACENGLLILPGLNPESDPDDWLHSAEGHPTHVMQSLLDTMGQTIGDIPLLPGTTLQSRDTLLSQWMRPAETTPRWRDTPPSKEALDSISLCQCHDREEEALTIAIALRETLETPGKTAALVTPDRMLAARVCAVMQRWGITLDDSGGEPLHATPLGSWCLSVLDASEYPLQPLPIIAALKSSFAAGGCTWPGKGFRNFVRALDRAWRGVLKNDITADLTPDLHNKLQMQLSLMTPLTTLAQGAHSLTDWVRAHVSVLESLAAVPGDDHLSGAQRLWIGPAGEALADQLRGLMEQSDLSPLLTLSDYKALLTHSLSRQSVRPPYGTHPRLSVLGLIESRFITVDRIILGGLNEGTWPNNAAHDPWMSHQMRQHAGFIAVERDIGLAAHDFAQAFNVDEVIMTRANRIDGTPTIPARWIARLSTWLKAGGDDLTHITHKGDQWVNQARHYDHNQIEQAATISTQRPAPIPCPSLFPDQISVTDVEILAKDPYSFYAKRLLNLKPLAPLAQMPGAAEKGTLTHHVMQDFVTQYPQGPLPNDAHEKLYAVAKPLFTAPDNPVTVRSLWWARFQAMIGPILAIENDRRKTLKQTYLEQWGETAITPDVKLVGKADRIEKKMDGQYAILDYKTGNIPKAADIQQGHKSQLTLEVAMLSRGGFALGTGNADEIAYWNLSITDTAKAKAFTLNKDVTAMGEQAFNDLYRLITSYRAGQRPYLSCPYGSAMLTFSSTDYAHLARTLEWSGVAIG